MITALLHPVGTRYTNSEIYDEATDELVHGFQVFAQKNADGAPTGRKTFLHNGLLWGISLAEKIRAEALTKAAPDMLKVLEKLQKADAAGGLVTIGFKERNAINEVILQAKGADIFPDELRAPAKADRTPSDILQLIKKSTVMLVCLQNTILKAPLDSLVGSYLSQITQFAEQGGFLQGIQLEELTPAIVAEIIHDYGEVVLCDYYRDYVKQQGLPFISADELIHEDSLTDEQRNCIADFSRRWEVIVDKVPA